MPTNFERVREFHEVYNITIGAELKGYDPDEMHMRLGLIAEEFEELCVAIGNVDIVETADAIADLLYVVYGLGVALKLPVDAVFAEVHHSNLSKLDENGKPIYRADGKVLKGPNFAPPDIAGVLRHYGVIK